MAVFGLTMRPSIIVLVLALAFLAVLVPEVSAKRYMVGGSKGWSQGVNYTEWAKDIHFYYDDWLFFVYDRNQMSVLEVNKTGYDNCTTDHLLGNFTTGAGRDVVHLNQTRHYYFISNGGFCYGGMKLAINVVKRPAAPKPAPVANNSPPQLMTSRYVLPVVFAIGTLWDSFLRVM